MSSHFDWDWDLEIQYNPAELGPEEPYEIYFFLGPVPPSPAEWRSTHSRLFEPVTSHGNTTIKEFRELNGYLRGRCEKDDDVITYLCDQLSWRVKKRYEDEEIEKSKLKSLKVSVYGPDGPTTIEKPKLDQVKDGIFILKYFLW